MSRCLYPSGTQYIFLHYTKQWTHRSASLVVVNVHLLSQITSPFSDIDELARELEAVADVVGATTPFPVAQSWHSNGDLWRPRLVTVVTRARLDATLAARPGYRVRHPRTHDGVDESCFSATCKNHGHIHLKVMFVLNEHICSS